MDGLLTAVSTTYRARDVPSLAEEKPPSPIKLVAHSPEEALEILRHEPDFNSLAAVLRFLSREVRAKAGLSNIAVPSPIGAQLVQVLVAEIAPNYWTVLREEGSDKSEERAQGTTRSDLQNFLLCLRSIPGVNAVLLRLRAFTLEAKAEKKDVKRPDLTANLRITLELLCALLEGPESPARIWVSSAAAADSPAKRKPLAQEFLTLLGSGRVISWAAEAEEVIKNTDKGSKESLFWITNRAEYCTWLTRSVAEWIACDESTEDAKLCSEVLARALRLGDTGETAQNHHACDHRLT